ncbi:MAG: sugar ABC transporter ATP-binding protein [Propionibacteriaceae bacterium]|jgi:ribose transport system ATP-binding protein|nr:sugar ABC transporter ATP-binding protein [Propionibacteriaceae bacterium]
MTLTLRDVRKSYGSAEVLHGVSLEAEYGRVVAIVGANGAGKSTLIKVLAGAEPKDSGTLELEAFPLDLKGPSDAIKQGIHTVYQELSLVGELSVAENLLMGQLPKRYGFVDWQAAYRRAGEILEQIGFAGVNVRAKTKDLPVAKQQMVEIAKALVTPPKILVLDEPSAVLAGSDLDSLFALVRQLRQAGTLVIYISHRLQEVLDIADTIVVMKDGMFVAELAPHATNEDDIIALMAGRQIDQIYPDRRTSFGEAALTINSLSRPGEFEDVNLQVCRGEVVSVFGLVGSGRSELAETIFGARRPAAGTIEVNGQPSRFKNPAQAMKAGLALMTEDRKRTGLVLGMKVAENITLATMARSFFLNLTKRRNDVTQMVSGLSIRPDNCASMEAWQLSGGNQQKAVLGKWLLVDPSILILDEPTRGVDMATRVDIYRKIDELAAAGLSVLMVSSDLTEAVSMADRVVVMREGCVVCELDAATTTEDEVLAHAIGGNQ